MGNYKLLSCGKIRMLCFKETINSGCLCTIVADLGKFLSISQSGNLKYTIPWTTLGRLNAIGSCCYIVKADGIFIGQVRAEIIVTVIIAASACYTDIGCGRSICGNKRCSFPFFHFHKIQVLFLGLF